MRRNNGKTGSHLLQVVYHLQNILRQGDNGKMTPPETRTFVIQCVLIVFYVVLAVLFARERKTWPMSIYYIGCFVKDSGVLVLGYLVAKKLS